MARARYQRRLPVPTHCWACGAPIPPEANRQGPPRIVCEERACIAARHKFTNTVPRAERLAG